MKDFIKYVLVTFFSLSFFFLFQACLEKGKGIIEKEGEEESVLVGEWQAAEGAGHSHWITFKEDGTYKTDYEFLGYEAKYTIEGNKIKITDPKKGHDGEVEFSLEGDDLKIKVFSWLKFKRKK